MTYLWIIRLRMHVRMQAHIQTHKHAHLHIYTKKTLTQTHPCKHAQRAKRTATRPEWTYWQVVPLFKVYCIARLLCTDLEIQVS